MTANTTTTKAPSMTTMVTCNCAVVVPPTEELSFAGDFGIIAYSFSRIAATIEQNTPFALSPNVAFLCVIPTLIFVVLLLAYRYIQHPVFTYQRDGPAKVGTRAKPGTPGIGVFSSSPRYGQNGAKGGFNATSRYAQNGANDLNAAVETEGKAGTENREKMVDTVDKVEAVEAVETVETVDAVETVAEATAGRLLPCLFRVVVGLSAFDATAVTEGGDKVLPGALPARFHKGSTCKTDTCMFHLYRLMWWYWQALKRNHAVLAPFLAPYDPRRGHGHYSSILLARYD